MKQMPSISHDARVIATAGVVVALAVVPFRSISSQQRFTVESNPTCHQCRIVLDHIVTLGSADDGVVLGPTSFIRRDSRGSFYIANRLDRGFIYVLDSIGHLKEKIGGTKMGDEAYFDLVDALLIDAGDTLRVFDSRKQRYTVIAPTREVVRTATFNGSVVENSYALLPNGDVVLNARMYDPNMVGFPFHRMNPGGHIISSFGPDGFWSFEEYLEKSDRRLAIDEHGNIWATFTAQYLLERWNTEGERDVVIERLADWFPANQPIAEITPTQSPMPRVQALGMDDKNRLWTLVEVSDSLWMDGLQALDDGRYFPANDTRVWDTVIELIDPRTNTLLVSERHDHHLIGFVDEQHVFSYRSRSTEGVIIYDVWRIRLTAN